MIEKNIPRPEFKRSRIFNYVGLTAAAFALASCTTGHKTANERPASTSTTESSSNTKTAPSKSKKDCLDKGVISVMGGQTTHEKPTLDRPIDKLNMLHITADPSKPDRINVIQTTQIETSVKNNEIDTSLGILNQFPYEMDLDPTKQVHSAYLHVEQDAETHADNFTVIVCGPR